MMMIGTMMVRRRTKTTTVTMNDGDNDSVNDGDDDDDDEDVDDDADDDEDDDNDDNDVLEKALDWPWHLHLVSNRTFIYFLHQRKTQPKGRSKEILGFDNV